MRNTTCALSSTPDVGKIFYSFQRKWCKNISCHDDRVVARESLWSYKGVPSLYDILVHRAAQLIKITQKLQHGSVQLANSKGCDLMKNICTVFQCFARCSFTQSQVSSHGKNRINNKSRKINKKQYKTFKVNTRQKISKIYSGDTF